MTKLFMDRGEALDQLKEFRLFEELWGDYMVAHNSSDNQNSSSGERSASVFSAFFASWYVRGEEGLCKWHKYFVPIR